MLRKNNRKHLLTQYFFQFFTFLLLSLAALGHAEDRAADDWCRASSAWPSEASDLEKDPAMHQGKLANGFRYVLKVNQEPRGRVAIYLYVHAGSLHEGAQERGFAHFLEHMMFKGTENYPADSLIDYFQSIGMDFGGDVNAYTSFDRTVYNLLLPDGSTKELSVGFSVMADYARRAILSEDQINQERRVILSEKRARDSASYRTYVASMEHSFRGTLLAERMVIGVERTLLDADRSGLKSFYDSWYQPENMVLVVVGDIDIKEAETLINKNFSALTPSGLKPPCPNFGNMAHKGADFFYHFEPALGKTSVSIESLWPLMPQIDSLSLQQIEIIRLMGTMIMGYRLDKVREKEGSPFVQAAYSAGDIIERIGYASITAETDKEQWQESLFLLEQTLSQVLRDGFTETEVERAKKEILAELDANMLTADSKDSRLIAKEIIDHLGSNRVYQSAEQKKILFAPIVRAVTATSLHQEFRALWNHDSRLVSVTGNVELGDKGVALIADSYRKAKGQKVADVAKDQPESFPYLMLPPPSASKPDRVDYRELDVARLIFANGLIVNLKKTQYQKNTVQISANFGKGEQSEPEPGMAMIVEEIINSSGSGRFPQSGIEALVAGSSVNLRFRVGETTFSWNGSALYKDFELLLQLLHTMLYDQGFRENQFGNVINRLEQMYKKAGQEIDGAMSLTVLPFLANGNPHFGLPAWSDVTRLNFTDLEKWVHTFSEPKDLEISIVGDFEKDAVQELIGKYFGGAQLQIPDVQPMESLSFPDGKILMVKVDTSIDKSLVVVAWPTEDFWNIERTRRLNVLAGVFEDRMRKVLRESLGDTYSPSVTHFSSRVYRGFGYIAAQVIIKPGSEERIIQEILNIADQLNEKGVTAEELVRVRTPIVTSINDTMRTNRYWLSSVLSLSSRYPQQLEWPQTILSDYSSINAEELTKVAMKYMDNKRAAIARVLPGGKPEAGVSTPGVTDRPAVTGESPRATP